MQIDYSKQAENILNFITEKYKLYPKKPTWNDIEEVEPDALDLEMLDAIKNDPDCHEFISHEDAMKELGL